MKAREVGRTKESSPDEQRVFVVSSIVLKSSCEPEREVKKGEKVSLALRSTGQGVLT